MNYKLKDKTNGVYAFVINSDFKINGQIINTRDGLGL
jgi:quercetin 2,3-dioxygenase